MWQNVKWKMTPSHTCIFKDFIAWLISRFLLKTTSNVDLTKSNHHEACMYWEKYYNIDNIILAAANIFLENNMINIIFNYILFSTIYSDFPKCIFKVIFIYKKKEKDKSLWIH